MEKDDDDVDDDDKMMEREEVNDTRIGTGKAIGRVSVRNTVSA